MLRGTLKWSGDAKEEAPAGHFWVRLEAICAPLRCCVTGPGLHNINCISRVALGAAREAHFGEFWAWQTIRYSSI